MVQHDDAQILAPRESTIQVLGIPEQKEIELAQPEFGQFDDEVKRLEDGR